MSNRKAPPNNPRYGMSPSGSSYSPPVAGTQRGSDLQQGSRNAVPRLHPSFDSTNPYGTNFSSPPSFTPPQLQLQQQTQDQEWYQANQPHVGPTGHIGYSAYPSDRTGQAQPEIKIPLDPQFRQIGIVSSNSETKEFRYHCHVEGCANTTCGRVQELKRHWDSFHEDSIIWCQIRGCERSKGVGIKPFSGVRKDKLKEHTLNVHGVELEL